MTPRHMMYHNESILRVPIISNPLQPLSCIQSNNSMGKSHHQDRTHPINAMKDGSYDSIGKHRPYRSLDDAHPLRPRQSMFPRHSPVHAWSDANIVLPVHSHQYDNSRHHEYNTFRPAFKQLPRMQSMIRQPQVLKHLDVEAIERSTTVQPDGHWHKRSRQNEEDTVANFVTPDSNQTNNASQRSSRYLREMDRHAILQRIEQGEKQSTIAKEYQVSRSTICNLYKNRHAIYSRTDADPHARHPKKKMKSCIIPPANRTSPTSQRPVNVPQFTHTSLPSIVGNKERGSIVELKTRAINMLLTKLESRETNQDDFDRGLERVMRLVQEEALAIIPSTSNGNGNEPLYALSLEQHRYLMLDVFHRLEPDRPTGSIRIYNQVLPTSYQRNASPINNTVSFHDPNLPQSLCDCYVVLLAMTIDNTNVLHVILRQLQARGASMSKVTIITLFINSDTLSKIQFMYPSLHVITAKVENSHERPSTTSIMIQHRLDVESTRKGAVLF